MLFALILNKFYICCRCYTLDFFSTIAKLISENPELLIYIDGKIHITVLGGIKLTGLDRLKVTLKLSLTGKTNTAYRPNLDLYNGIQTEQLIEKASEILDISTSETSQVI